MAVMGERQFTGGGGKNPSGPEGWIPLDMEGFWLCNKFLIRAVITILPIPFSFSAVIGDVFYPDPKIIKVLGACEQEFPRAIVKKRR